MSKQNKPQVFVLSQLQLRTLIIVQGLSSIDLGSAEGIVVRRLMKNTLQPKLFFVCIKCAFLNIGPRISLVKNCPTKGRMDPYQERKRGKKGGNTELNWR